MKRNANVNHTMKVFIKSVFLFVLLFGGSFIYAQEKPDSTSSGNKIDSAKNSSLNNHPDTTNEKSNTASADTGKINRKDPQNQLQFLKPDMESKDFNFYRRRAISVPQMMRLDLDSAVYQNDKKKRIQQKSYLDRQYPFPAKPKDAWELGINFGFAFVDGDVKEYIRKTGIFQNIGAGFTVRKAIGYSVSFRGGYNFMMMTGRNYEPDVNIKFNRALRGGYDPRVNYWDNNPDLAAANTKEHINMFYIYFHNFRMMTHEAHFEGVVNLGNIRFHKERTIVSFYAFAGGSFFLFNTKTDALDNNGKVHDFSPAYKIFLQAQADPDVNAREKLKKQAYDALDKIFDGNYESQAEHRNNVVGIKDWQFIPTVTLGAGLQFHVSKWVTIGIEQRFILTQEDLLDGYRWTQDDYASFTPNSDNISYTSLSVNFHLGLKKRTEPMYWLNPIYHSYKKIGEMDPNAIADKLFQDDDGDGVPNRMDREPNTKPDCPVDAHGVALDSDHDGIIDCLDKEPFSPPGYPIDSNGVAIIPPNPCCDKEFEGDEPDSIMGSQGHMIPNPSIAREPDSITGPQGKMISNPKAGEKIKTGKEKKRRGGGSGYDCSKIELPDVMFDQEKYYLDPQYYGNLHQIADRMQMCPDMRLVITGLDESRNDQKFNEQLAWNRANAAADYFTDKYGISRDRFIIKYRGGKKAATGTPYEKKMKNKNEFRYANEGETGESNPPAPHPGLKAGSNK